MILQQYLDWLKMNGIDAVPDTSQKGTGLPIEGYEPPQYVVWKNGRGTSLYQGFNVIAMDEDPVEALQEVQDFFGIAHGLKVSWKDFMNPPAVPGQRPDPVVGKLFRDDLYYVNSGKVEAGAKYTAPDGAVYLAVQFGMFDVKWKKIA